MSPTLDVINLNDIAHALSLCCRFGGHISEHYSVAEHSIRCMEYVEHAILSDSKFLDQFNIRWSDKTHIKLMLYALMHDASEAYLTDIPKPLKILLPKYQETEKIWEDMIAEKFELPKLTDVEHRFIKSVDYLMFRCECASLWKVNQDEFLYDFPETKGYWETYLDYISEIVPEKDVSKIETYFQKCYYDLKYKLKQLS